MYENKNTGFRTSVGGFNKKDVNEYIASMIREFQEKETAMRAENDTLLHKVNTLETEKERAIGMTEALACECYTANMAKETVLKLQKELETLKAELAKSREETAVLLATKGEGADGLLKELESVKEDNRCKDTELSILKEAFIKQAATDEENIETFRKNMEFVISEWNTKFCQTMPQV